MDQALDKMLRHARRKPIFTPGEGTTETNYGQDVIKRMIPHRDPFLFVDQITHVDLKQAAMVGKRFIREDDPVFRGHFPEQPIYPGALLLETLGQISLCMHFMDVEQRVEITAEDRPKPIRLLKLHHALFLEEVL
ncbi:MAG: 3-hydroxyacyl-ACP dehydratase FabZ family protein, partial [Myxococcota bacterium]